MWSDGARSIATINELTDYAEGVRQTTTQRFEALGGTVSAVEAYASDATDFRSQLTKLTESNPDAIHVAAQSEFTGGTIVKQLRELGYDGPIYGESVVAGTQALEIAGAAADGMKAIIPSPDLETERGSQFLTNFRERYGFITLPWFLGSAYDDVFIAAECLKVTEDDQDADGFRDCLYDLTFSGAIGDDFSFDDKGEVEGLSNVVVQVVPVAQRNLDNQGYEILGGAPSVE